MSELEELLAAEARHRTAIGDRDWAALAQLLAADMTYTHTTGLHQTRDEYLAYLPSTTPRTQARGPLTVRRYEDVALLTGILINLKGAVRVEIQVLQVWRRQQGEWLLVASQATRVQ